MPARTTAPTLLVAAGVIADLTRPVSDVGIDKECPICFECYNDGAESCLRLKACRHLVCKACIEKLSRTSGGLVTCPICRTSWLEVAASQETRNAATHKTGSGVNGTRPVSSLALSGFFDMLIWACQIIDLTLDDDLAFSDNSPHEEGDATNRAIGNIRDRAYQQQISRGQRWREFHEARARQRAAAEAHQRSNRPRTNEDTARAIQLPGRIERPGYGKLRSVRRSLLEEISSMPFERLAQVRIPQEPIIKIKETDSVLQIQNRARASQANSISPSTDTASDEPSRRARRSVPSPQAMPRLGRREPQVTEPSAQALEHHQGLQGSELRTRVEYLDRRKRELETRLRELHHETARPDHHTDPTAQRDIILSQKETSLNERESS